MGVSVGKAMKEVADLGKRTYGYSSWQVSDYLRIIPLAIMTTTVLPSRFRLIAKSKM